MPAFIAALIGALVQACGTIVGKVLVSLGISYVSYTGIDTSITWARDYLLTGLSALPANAVAVASTMKLGVCVSILTSALVARTVLSGLTGGALKRMVVRS